MPVMFQLLCVLFSAIVVAVVVGVGIIVGILVLVLVIRRWRIRYGCLLFHLFFSVLLPDLPNL